MMVDIGSNCHVTRGEYYYSYKHTFHLIFNLLFVNARVQPLPTRINNNNTLGPKNAR
jgi:hypothetical protein